MLAGTLQMQIDDGRNGQIWEELSDSYREYLDQPPVEAQGSQSDYPKEKQEKGRRVITDFRKKDQHIQRGQIECWFLSTGREFFFVRVVAYTLLDDTCLNTQTRNWHDQETAYCKWILQPFN